MKMPIHNGNNIFSKLLYSLTKQTKTTLFIILFIIMIKDSFCVYLESFQKESFAELDSLIEINDYYNLSIFMTSKGEIYEGIPPSIIMQTSNSNIISYTSGVTYDEKYLFLACTENYLLTKINIETREETPLINYENISMPNYTCGIFHDNNIKDYLYISMSHIVIPENETENETNSTNIISDINLSESAYLSDINIKESDTNLKESYYTDYLSYLINTDNYSDIFFEDDDITYRYSFDTDDKYSPFLQHSVIRIKLKNNEDDTGPIIDETFPIDKYILKYTTKYYWDLPSSSIFSCEIINLNYPNVVCGYIEDFYGRYYAQGIVIAKNFSVLESSTNIFDLENKVSSIKLQKTNYNKIIVMVNLHCFELSLERLFGKNRIQSSQNQYFQRYESSDDLFFYNNDFLFSSTGTSNEVYIRKNNSFNYFKLKEPLKNITKILGFYNEINETLLYLYEFEHDKIVYFTLYNITFLYEFKAKQEIIKVLSNTLSSYNVSELINDPKDHDLLQLESITHYIDTKQRAKTYDKYTFENETQNLTVYESENDWVTFNFYYE